MTTPEPETRSRFAQALKRLVESTKLPASQWAERLGVSAPAIGYWLKGTHLPRSDRLYAFIKLCRGHAELDAEAAGQFAELAREPAWRVVSDARQRSKLHPSVGHYMLQGLREALNDALAALPPRAEEELLLEQIARCEELRQRDPAQFDLFAAEVELTEAAPAVEADREPSPGPRPNLDAVLRDWKRELPFPDEKVPAQVPRISRGHPTQLAS